MFQELHWWPPKKLNGVIDRYEIFWNEILVDTSDDDELIAANVTCDPKYDCSIISKQRVDLNDDSHFSREVFLLEDILPNYIFVPRKATDKKPTIQEDKIQKNISIKIEETLLMDEEDQDLGIAGLEIKDGIKDDFNPNPLKNEVYKNPNSIPSAEKTTGVKKVPDSEEHNEKLEEVDGSLHTLLISGLQSEEHYMVSIRACVKATISKTPCGPLLTMHASPINLSTAKFFEKYNISIV